MAQAEPRLTVQPGRIVWIGGGVLLAAYAAMCLAVPVDFGLLRDIFYLPAIGILGAVIANTSGTGGGVVFVPVFNALREHGVMALDPLQVVGASMLIQSFGMTMGALRWTDRLLHQPALPAGSLEAQVRWQDFVLVAGAVLALSLPAMLATQRLASFDGPTVLLGYKAFSILLGLALITLTWTINLNQPERARLERFDLFIIMLLAIPGGAITALFSVGIGELVALYLFMRHYPVLLCTGAACVISSVSVILGSIWHIEAGTIQWEVLLLAGPGQPWAGFWPAPSRYGWARAGSKRSTGRGSSCPPVT